MSVEARNKEAQSDECEALSSIYAESFRIVEADNRVHAPWLKSLLYDSLIKQLDRIVEENVELPVVYLMIETISSFLQLQLRMMKQQQQEKSVDDINASPELVVYRPETSSCIPTVRFHLNALPNILPMAVGKVVEIFHGDPIVDRKSVFQAHCAQVTMVGQVSWFTSTLLSDRKVAAATHNILAWRLSAAAAPNGQSSGFLADCDDDGENQAGGRLLHLLTVTDARNVAVMVTRWYGGIQLGPDRFKHINNAARQLLHAQGMLNPAPSANLSDKKARRKRKS